MTVPGGLSCGPAFFSGWERELYKKQQCAFTPIILDNYFSRTRDAGKPIASGIPDIKSMKLEDSIVPKTPSKVAEFLEEFPEMNSVTEITPHATEKTIDVRVMPDTPPKIYLIIGTIVADNSGYAANIFVGENFIKSCYPNRFANQNENPFERGLESQKPLF